MIIRGQPRVSCYRKESRERGRAGGEGREGAREVGRKEEETKEERKKGWTLCLL